MKKIFLLIILISQYCLANNDNLDCASNGLSFFPSEKEISLNSNFIIEGYAMSQKTIINLKDKMVYLEDKESNKIHLEIIEILKGEMNLTQAILKPKNQLKPNTTYFLRISNLNEIDKDELYKWNYNTNEKEPISWKTKNIIFSDLINENLEIEYSKNEATLYGCGPAIYSIFEVKNSPNIEVWYRTEVVNIKTNIKTTYILINYKTELKVGHGMCSGAFRFLEKSEYKLRFTPMNTDGKMNITTKWKKIKNPNNEKAFGF